MSKIFNPGTVFGAVAFLSMLSFGSMAEASTVLSCKADSASTVTSCCEQAVSENGRPAWMTLSRTSCHAATVCTKKKCYIKAAYFIESKSKDSKGGKK